MKRKKILLNIVSLIICLYTIIPIPLICHADNEEAQQLFLNGVTITEWEMGPRDNDLLSQIQLIVNIVYELIGVIFFILIIYGGILWMTAGGKDEQVKKAQNIIQRSAIGLFIVVLAYAITYFILNVVFRVQHVPLKIEIII